MDAGKPDFLRSMRLYVLLTQAHCRVPILEAAETIIRGGADVVQLREKDSSDRDLLRLAHVLRKMTHDAGVGFILNDRPDLAVTADADGVHLGQEDLPPDAARRILLPHQVLGISTHSLDQAVRARDAGTDYIGVGPVFPTATRGYEQGVGLDYIRAAATAVELPLVAIGGIRPENVADIIRAAEGAHVCIAVCRAILGADDIEAATRAFKAAIGEALGR